MLPSWSGHACKIGFQPHLDIPGLIKKNHHESHPVIMDDGTKVSDIFLEFKMSDIAMPCNLKIGIFAFLDTLNHWLKKNDCQRFVIIFILQTPK